MLTSYIRAAMRQARYRGPPHHADGSNYLSQADPHLADSGFQTFLFLFSFSRPFFPCRARTIAQSHHFIETGEPAVLALPTVSCRGTVPVTPAGICRSTCNPPATKPGAAPAYRIWAACPPICAETGASGLGYTELLTPPSTPVGLVCPSPVAYSPRTPPGEAGFEAEIALPSRLVMAKIPGAVLTTGKVTVLVALPCTTTCIIVLLFPATS